MERKEITITKSDFRMFGLQAIQFMDGAYTSLIRSLDVTNEEKVNMMEDYAQQRDLILVYQNAIEQLLFSDEPLKVSEEAIQEISQEFGEYKGNCTKTL